MIATRNGFTVETKVVGFVWTTTVSKHGVQLASAKYRTPIEAVLGHAKRCTMWLDEIAADHVETPVEFRVAPLEAPIVEVAPTLH